MNAEEPSYGPLQILLVGFETTERFRGEIARELLDLRGRGMIRVIDARFLHRAPDGQVTETDLGPLLADRISPLGFALARCNRSGRSRPPGRCCGPSSGEARAEHPAGRIRVSGRQGVVSKP